MDGASYPPASARRRSTESRQLLPVEAYTSQDWFRREQTELFGRTWSFVGMTEDVQNPGDYKCVEVGGAPFFVLRDRQGELRAFHNVCRHRGTRILEGSGSVQQSITCFYHKWSYDLGGRLVGIPQERTEFPDIDKSGYGLHRAQVATARNLIFLNPDPEAEPLDRYLANAVHDVGPHDPERLVEVGDLLYRVRANWKVVVENFIDSYHLFYLHAVSLGDGDFQNLRQWPAGRHWNEKRGLKPGRSHDSQLLPVIEGVSPDYGLAACWIFPNLGLVTQATHWLTFHVIPVEPGLSLVNLRIRANPEALAAADKMAPIDPGDLPDYILHAKGPYTTVRLDLSGKHPLESNSVMREDIFACEAVQAGMRSARWQVGPLSSWEESMTFFQRQILAYMPA